MAYPRYKIPGVLLLAALQAAGIAKGCPQRRAVYRAGGALNEITHYDILILKARGQERIFSKIKTSQLKRLQWWGLYKLFVRIKGKL